MINAFCGAFIIFCISLMDSAGISSAMFWFMGNLAAASLPVAGAYALVLAPACVAVIFCGHVMNLLMLGEEEAATLGLRSSRAVLLLLIVSSLMTGALVATVGPLGFVGLVIPQMLRLALGADCRLLAPACFWFGAAFLVWCDLLARMLPEQGELPSGVITALIGAPVFILLQRKSA
jgi:iron complex transport system permease protein